MQKVLAIETSCDETGIAIVSLANGSYTVLADALNSQIDIHREFGGVFPMAAKREHGQNLLPLLQICLSAVGGQTFIPSQNQIETALTHLEREVELQKLMETELQKPDSFLCTKPDIDALVVTAGPGLEPALWVGISFAKALATLWNIPVLPINHMEGHIASIMAEAVNGPLFPAFALLISGGHTEVVLMKDWGSYSVIGKTRDDAVGEAYDKAARILGLGYPGGPEISKRATAFRKDYSAQELETMCRVHNITLPRPMIQSKDLDFSFSGLKTAVLYLVRDLKIKAELTEEQINLICYEFEEAVVEVLLAKLMFAKRTHNAKTLVVAGGVIANTYIREKLEQWCIDVDMQYHKPNTHLATDNAVMIGLAGLIHLDKKYAKLFASDEKGLSNITARGGWKIDDVY